MLKIVLGLWALVGNFMLPCYIQAAHFENLVELTIKIEDASFNLKVKSVKFNNQEIKLDESDMFKPRKVAQYKLPPGRYMLAWTTDKRGVGLSNAPVTIDNERILVLESGDAVVRVNIKGDSASLY